jgi:glycosyltransferase involved in cell wall biosynthesis
VKVALLHYHLRRGGVTSVVCRQAEALREAGEELLVITGETPQEDFAFPWAVTEALAYDRPGETVSPERAQVLADGIFRSMEKHWGGAADIIHVHNPLIRKNSVLMSALKILISRGLRLLLQNHDLAEDFRPDVYTMAAEYPENCHYAAINNRDYTYLHRAGLKREGLHLLPNAVAPVTAAPDLRRTRFLYPVRAISRKNVGEALLLSLFIPRGTTIGITLPPVNRENRIYNHWVQLAGELDLPVEFALGLEHSLSELYGTALGALSTSNKEGFGFSFLEPWTAGRGLIGRRIDYVCRDFEEQGVRFDSLYREIGIPAIYVSPRRIINKMRKALGEVYGAFGAEIPSHVMRIMIEDISSRETLDFGRLDDDTQESIIRVLAVNRGVYQDIAGLNPFLEQLSRWKGDEELIEHNRETVLRMYGRERIFRILFDAYRAVMERPVVHKLSKQMMLDLYLDPLRFSLAGIGHG